MDDLKILISQYNQQLDPNALHLPDGSNLIKHSIQETLYTHMFDDSLWPLPPVSYRARVLKMIIGKLEEAILDPEEDEINPDLMNTWTTLLMTPKPSAIQAAQQLSYIKYTSPHPSHQSSHSQTQTHQSTRQHESDAKAVTVITSESRGLILGGGTTGFRTWEAALHLGTYLTTSSPNSSSLVQGKKVIELGAGTGFLSLLCAKLGAREVVSTDMEEALLDGIRDCIVRNDLEEGLLRPVIWDWGKPFTPPSSSSSSAGKNDGEDGGFDIGIGADLIYDTDLIPLLLTAITTLFNVYHIEYFLISATLRNQDTFNAFLDACGKSNLQTECLEFRSPSEKGQTGFFHSTAIPIRTYRISRGA